MDRLQQAIAQARLTREAILAGSAAPALEARAAEPVAAAAAAPAEAPAPAPSQSQSQSQSRSDNWNALQAFNPSDDVLARNLVVTRRGGPEAAPVDVLRTRAVQQMGQNGWTRLAVTSPDPGCGKSTVTMNLAFSLARLDELRIVVIDLDLRRPALANLMGFDGGHSVGRVLQGRAELDDQMVRVGSNLAFATTAEPVRTPAELLQGGRVARLLDRIRDDYAPDIQLFDLPPLLVSDDALAFLPLADCALMVAAAEQSSLDQVDNCEKEIAAQTAMLGVVLNRCAHPGPGYGYGYGSY